MACHRCRCCNTYAVIVVASRKEVVTLLKTVFSTLTVAMRYEPANARLFANEVTLDSAVSLSSNIYISFHRASLPTFTHIRTHIDTLAINNCGCYVAKQQNLCPDCQNDIITDFHAEQYPVKYRDSLGPFATGIIDI